MDDLTGFQRDLLYVVGGLGHPSGQTIRDDLEAYYDGGINHGRLYPNLDALVDKRLVERGELDGRTNSYGLTDAGRDAIRARRKWEGRYFAA